MSLVSDDLAKAILLYNPKFTTEKKILFALNHLGSGDVNTLTEYLIRVDGHVKDAIKFGNGITYTASRLHRAGKLMAEKKGKRNVYKLVT